MNYWINQYIATPEMPGGTRHYDLAMQLKELGVPMTLVGADLNLSTRGYGARENASDRRPIHRNYGGVPFVWLFTPSYTRNDWRRYWSMVRFSVAVFLYLLRAPIQPSSVFIGSSPHLLAALAGALAAKLRRVRFVLEVRDLWPESLVEIQGRESAVSHILRRIAYYLYRRARYVIILAEGNRRAVARAGVRDEQFLYVPNGVDPHAFTDAAQTEATNSTAKKLRAVYTGAHGAANDLDTLIDAAAYLTQKGRDDIEIVLLGDGPEKPHLVRMAAAAGLTNVVFLAPIPKGEIPRFLHSAAVGVLVLRDVPLFRYGVSPNKLFDYMAAGLPIVTNVAGECTDIVNQANCGIGVPPGDPVALAEGLQQLADAEDRTTLGVRGRDYVFTHFNRRLLAERLLPIFSSTATPAKDR